MALLPCPECGREVSTRANACPHCGCPVGEALLSEAERAGASGPELRELQALVVPRPAPPLSALGRCSSCGSEDIRRVSLVYESETQRITTHSMATGVGAVGGDAALVAGATTATGTRQALLAQRLAPPTKQSEFDGALGKAGCLTLFVLVFAITKMFGDDAGALAFIGALVVWGGAAGAGVFRSSAAMQWNALEWPKLRAQWERSVVCMRCGTISDPEAA